MRGLRGEVRLAGRRGAAAGGQGRAAGAHPRQPRRLLPAVGEDLGVPGAAQGPAGRRRPASWARHYVEALSPLVWSAAERPGLRRGRAGDAPPGRGDPPAAHRRARGEARPRRAARRRVRGAAAAAGARPGRRDAPQLGTTLVALEPLAAGGYVGREDARAPGRGLPLAAHGRAPAAAAPAAPHPPAARRTTSARCAGSPGRSGLRGDVLPRCSGSSGTRHAREVRRLHEKLFYRPLLAAVARLPAPRRGSPRRPPGSGWRRSGFADPAGALRHLEALTAGVSPPGGDPADPAAGACSAGSPTRPTPTPGCSRFRQVVRRAGHDALVPAAAARRGHGRRAAGRLLARSRYVADLLARAPEAVAAARRRRRAGARAARAELAARASCAVARRDDDWEPSAVARARPAPAGAAADRRAPTCSATRRRRGRAGAVRRRRRDIAAALEIATAQGRGRARGGALPMRLAVIAMGRLGGSEQGYGSRRRRAVRARAGRAAPTSATRRGRARRRQRAAPAARRCPRRTRRCASTPTCAPRAGKGRWSAVAGVVRAATTRAGRSSGRRRRCCGPRRSPATRSSAAAFLAAGRPAPLPGRRARRRTTLREIRRIKARVESERLPRGADRTLHTKLGPGGLADVEWTVQLLQLQHAAERAGAADDPDAGGAATAAADAGLLDAASRPACWRRPGGWPAGCATRSLLVRGPAGDSCPPTCASSRGVARVLGYPPGATGEFVDDYRRATRRARAVVERVFYR